MALRVVVGGKIGSCVGSQAHSVVRAQIAGRCTGGLEIAHTLLRGCTRTSTLFSNEIKARGIDEENFCIYQRKIGIADN